MATTSSRSSPPRSRPSNAHAAATARASSRPLPTDSATTPASRYRGEEEVEKWEARDPIIRLRRYLDHQGLWDDDQETILREEAQSWVDAQIKVLEEMPPQEPEEMFTSMYAAMPPHVAEQMGELIQETRS